MFKRKKIYLICLALLFLIWLNNTGLFSHREGQDYKILAHRGLAQTFDESKADWDSNTAAMIDPPAHPYLENTIPSMQAAFDLGADAVEFDVKLSKDKQLAVFHDSTLEYKCGVKGEVQDYTMDQLKKMDIGYGYTADGGKNYPFRGRGVGQMPTMDEVLERFPDKEFVIEVKDGKLETYKVLWRKLKTLSPERLDKLSVCGASEEGVNWLRSQSRSLKLLSKESMIRALIKYELLGFTGYIPEEMKNAELRIPLKYAKFLWGWPYKFMDRMESVNTRVELTAGGADLSVGFDDVTSLESVPKEFGGYIWTNKINELHLKED
ncbi:Glycerophosphoryl diester phosphodiesterase [Streptococcus sp. DD11]|uniref:glycerophosphodiester phosphodiesterase family protein n=1 Tax=Streptococcus sp. DD11 TaxID=1777879 RepID=UPI000796F212|nr:glycerophosphodiester phosphodiesterase family protein [Streptococcus sp. DD11]KXT84460.1 Glycerophosphoryl diester phosphodiesterase [Streptococcus sp. DD11]